MLQIQRGEEIRYTSKEEKKNWRRKGDNERSKARCPENVFFWVQYKTKVDRVEPNTEQAALLTPKVVVATAVVPKPVKKGMKDENEDEDITIGMLANAP